MSLFFFCSATTFELMHVFSLFQIHQDLPYLGSLGHLVDFNTIHRVTNQRCPYYVQTYKAFAHIPLMVECKLDQERKVSMSHICSKLAFVVAFVVWSSYIPMTKVFCFKTICLLGDNIKIHWVLMLNFFELCVEEAFQICIFSSGTQGFSNSRYKQIKASILGTKDNLDNVCRARFILLNYTINPQHECGMLLLQLQSPLFWPFEKLSHHFHQNRLSYRLDLILTTHHIATMHQPPPQ